MTGKVLKVVMRGDPLLQKKSVDVQDPLAPDIQTLIRDMEATIAHLKCSGLAAPQVGVALRLAVFRVMTGNPLYPLTPDDDPKGVDWTVMINPKITPLSEEKRVGWEPCQSIPGMMGQVARYHAIQYTFLNREGREETRVAKGFHARVVQHETDHLDGILFPDRMEEGCELRPKEEVLASLRVAS